MEPDNTRPKHQHDCAHCRFLYGSGALDVYWCIENGSGQAGSVIARHGSDGPDYMSFPVLNALQLDFDKDSYAVNALRAAARYLIEESLVGAHVNPNALAQWDALRE